jgi:hypothetical protein
MYHKLEKTRNGVLTVPFRLSKLSKLYDVYTEKIIVRIYNKVQRNSVALLDL